MSAATEVEKALALADCGQNVHNAKALRVLADEVRRLRSAEAQRAAPQAGDSEAQMREAFEAEWRRASRFHLTRDPNTPGDYAISQVQAGWLMWQAALRSPEAQRAGRADGFVLVPVVPTEEMQAAFRSDREPYIFVRTTAYIGDFIERYRAMLSAAPAAPSAGQAAPATAQQGDWILRGKHINELQQESIAHVVKRCKQAHYTDLDIRINGKNEREQADWIKWLEPATAQARWRPISTAPRDGSSFILFDGRTVAEGYYEIGVGGCWRWADGVSCSPTLWQELPAPPPAPEEDQ